MPGTRRIDSADAVMRAAQLRRRSSAATRRRARGVCGPARPRFVNPRAGAIAIHARRRDVDEALRYNSRPRQRRDQLSRARIVAAFGGRRREMQHRKRRERQAGERCGDRRGRRRSGRCHARAGSACPSRRRVRPKRRARLRESVARRAAQRRRSRSSRTRITLIDAASRQRERNLRDAVPDYHKAQRALVRLRATARRCCTRRCAPI